MTLPGAAALASAPPSERRVAAPLPGTVIPLTDVPDAVFAAQLLGAGVAVEPAGSRPADVLTPITGTLTTLYPHAFVVVAEDGRGILVHLGIDTIRLGGVGFTPHVTVGTPVTCGEPIITFDLAAVRAVGLSAICPVVVLDAAPNTVRGFRPGALVRPREPLFVW